MAKTKLGTSQLRILLSKALVSAVIVALILSVDPGFVKAQGSDNVNVDGGVIPESVLQSYPNMDPRLIGAPIKKTDVTSSLVAYARAVQNVNNLEFERKTLTENLDLLVPAKKRAEIENEAFEEELETVTSAFLGIIRSKYQESSNNRNQNNSGFEQTDDLRREHQSVKVLESLIEWKEKAEKRVEETQKILDNLTEKIEGSKARIEEIGQELVGARKNAEDRSNVVRSGIPVAVIPDLDIPVMAMDAYLRAERYMAQNQPECGIKWWSLAAIGRAESNHGRFGGATFDFNGTVTPPIIGVALNGNGFAAISDTDGGTLDGDTEWDRAVGPMQFIPGTWKRWGADGNGDGVINPQNIYDAMLAAARYLCASAQPNMTTDEGRRKAYFAYNRSTAYVTFLTARGSEYDQMTNGRYNL